MTVVSTLLEKLIISLSSPKKVLRNSPMTFREFTNCIKEFGMASVGLASVALPDSASLARIFAQANSLSCFEDSGGDCFVSGKSTGSGLVFPPDGKTPGGVAWEVAVACAFKVSRNFVNSSFREPTALARAAILALVSSCCLS